MPKRTSDHGKHNRTPLLGGLKDSMNALAADLGLSKPKKHDTNPFGDALRETSERKGGIIDELTRHAVALSPVIKRRTFPELENVPEGLVLGWAQLPSTRGRGFSLGIFPDRDHFAQVAFADTHGRVFVGTDPNMDVQDMQARFMFGKEKEVTLPDGERLQNAVGGDAGRQLLQTLRVEPAAGLLGVGTDIVDGYVSHTGREEIGLLVFFHGGRLLFSPIVRREACRKRAKTVGK